ncbi:Serine/threonine-protein kinase PLK4 [Cytospora mali]|uniref:non-specific serine/threonine protein kinase n=1 Tax=Cytospora mali TaxID=578113 RepID=A0A194W6M3_CYTMA|nr:Serine/threonine-protein kinase PLK4 [Valsa mali]
MDAPQIIQSFPIGTHLDTLHGDLSRLVQKHGSLDSVNRTDVQVVTIQIASSLLGHPAAERLPSTSGRTNLRDNILRLIHSISTNFDFSRVKPLLAVVLKRDSDQELWDQVYKVVTESTPTPQSTPQLPPGLASQTPRTRSTGYVQNSSQHRTDTDSLLKEELGALYGDVPDFYNAFFGRIPGLQAAADAIFEECQQGASPNYQNGKWVDWPEDAGQDDVLEWLKSFCAKLGDMAKGHGLTTTRQILPLGNKYVESATPAKRKPDVAFVDILQAQSPYELSFSQIHILGELKSNAKADTAAQAWFDIARYAKEVFASQDDRRFILAFTLCGSRARVWEFDRAGCIGSVPFDVHGSHLVLTFLGFLTMGRADIGYDPTIRTTDSGEQFIEITRNSKQERLFLQSTISRVPCLVGRATTCWKAYNENHPDTILVIKDSWQYPEREEEGDLLREASARGVTNVAKYYHHETVQVDGRDDNTLHIRNNLDLSRSLNPWPLRSPGVSRGRSALAAHLRRSEQSRPVTLAEEPGGSSTVSRKRGSSPNNAQLPPSKRSHSVSLADGTKARVHRRVILCDYGIPIYLASSRKIMLAALESCVRGHRSLLDANLLHRDISMNNLMISEEDPAHSSFLIDLDLAVDMRRADTSGSKGVTGTPAFTAIGALDGEPHTFIHDLESFFWVLFWICIHYPPISTGQDIVIRHFERWNYMRPRELALEKQGLLADRFFLPLITQYFTPSYQALIPWELYKNRAIPTTAPAPITIAI